MISKIYSSKHFLNFALLLFLIAAIKNLLFIHFYRKTTEILYIILDILLTLSVTERTFQHLTQSILSASFSRKKINHFSLKVLTKNFGKFSCWNSHTKTHVSNLMQSQGETKVIINIKNKLELLFNYKYRV